MTRSAWTFLFGVTAMAAFCAPALAGGVPAGVSNAQEGTAKLVTAVRKGTGFEGRVVREGQIMGGARIYAYKDFADVLACRPFSVSAPTADDGTYRMDLPPGTYYLVAKKRSGAGDGPLEAGDYHCFHGSNPISAAPGAYTHVGFSMLRDDHPAHYTDGSDPGSGTLTGVVTYMGKPLAGVYVTLYLDAKADFKGQGYSSSPPTGKSGKFRVDLLPESDYFVIARKRATGANAGPLTDGDYFGYYVGNPVTVKAGKTADISLEVISKAGEIGKDDSLFRNTGTQIRGRITDKDGHVVKGAYAFAYKEKVMAHKRPAFISRQVDDKGGYVINVAEGGTYYIGARSAYGDSPGIGEWYGRYDATPDHHVDVKSNGHADGIDITVEKILQ